MLLDTHAHLDFPELSGDFPGVLNRARENGIYEIITIGIDIPSSQKAIEIAQGCAKIFATVGIHPHGAARLDANTLETLRKLAGEKKVVAIGEIGLDYFRNYQPRDIQGECLRQQLRLACEVNLPVVFHIRDAFNDFFEIVQDYIDDLKGLVLHCFSGDWKVAERCLDMGGYLSIPGTVTFPKAEAQQDVVKRAPLDRLLLETDAPYLTPVPYRGKDNEPSYLLYTARKVAELRGLSVDEVARHTTLNAHHVFGLDEIMDSRD
jgi:TatD DNase family protein